MSGDMPASQNPHEAETAPERHENAAGTPSHDRLIGRSIGGYTITRVIASGGMGTVYLAHQERPRRVVAVKVMRRDVSSRHALHRFEYESQTLARLRHPNIAQVYEAGTYDDGSGAVPFFAMEYVANARAVTVSANERRLSLRERLELFAQICDAVHHGHQKGIIHRDLKPSNILVDSSGQPKIIDFGVARSTDSDMAVTTLQTDIGQLIGTLQYMSPEQCDADPHDIDTRSDIYALGVVLYELLCGHLPYDIRRVALHEAARVIRETLPPRPGVLNRDLRGDVETIALKTIEKDRSRRYQSLAELRLDIHCVLRSEPIRARRAGLLRRLRLFVRRHRYPVVLAGVTGFLCSVIVLVVLVWMIDRSWMAYRLERSLGMSISMVLDDPEVMERLQRTFDRYVETKLPTLHEDVWRQLSSDLQDQSVRLRPAELERDLLRSSLDETIEWLADSHLASGDPEAASVWRDRRPRSTNDPEVVRLIQDLTSRQEALERLYMAGRASLQWTLDGREVSEPSVDVEVWLHGEHDSSLRMSVLGDVCLWSGTDESHWWVLNLLADEPYLEVVCLHEENLDRTDNPSSLADWSARLFLVPSVDRESLVEERIAFDWEENALIFVTNRPSTRGGAAIRTIVDRATGLPIRVEMLSVFPQDDMLSILADYEPFSISDRADLTIMLPTTVVAQGPSGFRCDMRFDHARIDDPAQPWDRVFDAEIIRRHHAPSAPVKGSWCE